MLIGAIFWAMAAGGLMAVPAGAVNVYTSDFASGTPGDPIGLPWSNPAGGSLIISQTPSGINFLGTDVFWGLVPGDAPVLSLDSLPPHTVASVSFQLFIISSWDGNAASPIGPDIFNLTVSGGPTLINTTFANWTIEGFNQAYPGQYPGGDYPARTNAAEVDTLGYWDYTKFDDTHAFGDSVYSLSFTFAHTGDNLTLNFSTLLPEGFDEYWGLNNVVVDVVPLPPTLLLVGPGILGLIGWRRLRVQ